MSTCCLFGKIRYPFAKLLPIRKALLLCVSEEGDAGVWLDEYRHAHGGQPGGHAQILHARSTLHHTPLRHGRVQES